MKDLEKVLHTFENQADFLDIRLLEEDNLSIVFEDKEVKCGAKTVRGIGVRSLVDGCWAFSSTSTVSLIENSIRACIKSARRMAPGSSPLPDYTFEKGSHILPVRKKVQDVDISEKIKDIHHLKDTMELPLIKDIKIYYSEFQGKRRILNTMGCDIEETFSRISLDFFSFAFQNGRVEMTADRKYRMGGYETVETIGDLPSDVSRRAEELLSAQPLKGVYPVILDSELTGVFAHEALGHCAEADVIQEGGSFLQDKLHERVTCEEVSVCDDPHVQEGSVSFLYDDEGVPAHRNVLVERGTFKGFLHSLETAACHNTNPTGTSRVDTYSSRPVIRMTNTFVLPGKESSEELIEPVKRGVFLKKTFGAQVNTTTGEFVFKAQEGDLIEKGELTRKLKNILIYGTMEEFLQKIEGVGRDFYMSSGTCAKAGQVIPIGSGGPPLRLSEMKIGVSQ